MSVTVPSEKNFRRAKVRPVKRRGVRGWISWRLVGMGVGSTLVVYAGYRAVDLVLTAPALAIHRVTVRGNVQLSTGEIHALTDGLAGGSILTADLAAYRRRLLDSPWVEEVAIRRLLPSTIEVFVSERRPIGLSRLGRHLYMVDRRGTIIDEFGPQYSEFDLPIIDGLVRAPGTGQSAIDEARAELAGRVIEALAAQKELARRVSQIDVSDVHDAVVLLDDDPALLHLGDEQFAERLQYYVELAPALRENVRDMDYVDLRFGERVYVRPAGDRARKKF